MTTRYISHCNNNFIAYHQESNRPCLTLRQKKGKPHRHILFSLDPDFAEQQSPPGQSPTETNTLRGFFPDCPRWKEGICHLDYDLVETTNKSICYLFWVSKDQADSLSSRCHYTSKWRVSQLTVLRQAWGVANSKAWQDLQKSPCSVWNWSLWTWQQTPVTRPSELFTSYFQNTILLTVIDPYPSTTDSQMES